MLLQIHAVAVERHTFGAQSQTLFESVLARKQNPPASPQNAMPGNRPAARAQSPDHLPGRARISARRRHIAIRGDSAFWNTPNRREHPLEHHSDMLPRSAHNPLG